MLLKKCKLYSKCHWVLFIPVLLSILLMDYSKVYGNETKIDSLNRVLEEASHDSTIYYANLNLGHQWEAIDFDSAMVFYNKSIEIAERNNWISKKAQALINIGFAYMYVQNSKDAIEFLLAGLELYIEANDSIGIMNSYYNLGYFYGTFEDFPKSIESFRKAEEFALELNNEKRLAGIYNNLGLMYHYMGQYDKANNYNFKSLNLSNKIGDKSVGYTHINIGLNYNKEGNYEKSLEHYRNALVLFQESNKKQYIALVIKSIGDIYLDTKKYDSALLYYNKSYLIYKELDDLESMSRYFMVLGIIDYEKKEFAIAELNFHKAINILPEDGSRKLLFAIYSNIIDLNLYLSKSSTNNQKLLNETVSYAKKMNHIALELGSYIMEAESYEKLYKTYSKSDNLKQAIKYAEQYIIAKDSLFSERKQKTITELQTKYETEKKELEINLLNSKNELINTRLSQSDSMRKTQRVIIYLLIVGFLIVVVSILIISKLYRQTKRANAKLIAQNVVIIKQKEEKELLIKEIHHRVKNNLQIISSLFDLQLRGTENPETKSALIDGLNRIKSVGLIHELLYQTDDVINIEFEDFVIKLLDHISSFATDKPISKHVNIPHGLKFDINTTIPLGLIITELLTNAFKYAFNEVDTCSISINLETYNNNQFIIEVIDNGIGMPKEYDLKTSKSLGLRLVRTLSEQLSGTIDYKYENGAKFVLTFSKKVPHE